ncbi:cysteine--tRNA ligase [Rickettsia rickettsii]|uniref:Cysteine--tRNA ligase n=2 Tax=Rickettsia rickettsii TaxID=783 RepID=SYC_RICRO|nr:cysteine--tRNA ligase [Rickettsia rickettsii]A8GQP6.1 RecName: Full=Cysteine--tRNA ligase; AltName: Full=Cysteinyl-tRNA synthetase; Short=CysRS [Rickettsia rickettsii str. 'Sheila Smith']B0BW37.1 RecName: Full=Cysteine--tRNA ligase; AltName: Full=Cysteinyl-tRNA synthetase; Short=CysRS [Rickettsia rickettsii str. Iowa]ABV75721.1 cysteinyl-tRNA synthetase [Rickettsia rickettsii str. 'Sheila Smith']ABY72063.1 cysteinyl-tRNA synthetase [Rickettsia rickettsii str. Iowa]AFB22715.1 cysteinyl-tRNA 
MQIQFRLYNTLSRTKEVFNPQDQDNVKMYVCGPTVYYNPHIGNSRSGVVYDLLYRIVIKIFGEKAVKYVRNITDVDDKIIDRAALLGVTIDELTDKVTKEFHKNMAYLGCMLPSIEPKATKHIDVMIAIIERLIAKDHAYIADNHVYFDVLSAPNYTELSNRNLEEMFEGVHVENSKTKKNPQDFVLWKPAKQNESANMNFESPWGLGRPGWHIECSAMSYKYLGENFDIHGGGADLIFPHHTNEIAQSRCAFPSSTYAKYWVHNGFLTVNGEKMSKSLGNFITVRDLMDKQIQGEVVRLFLLSSHYRRPLDYNDKAIEDAKKTLDYWYRAIENINVQKIDLPHDFMQSLLDDMNTPLAVKIINDYAKGVFISKTEEERQLNASAIITCANFIGLMNKSPHEWFNSGVDELYINELVNKRLEAKKHKNWLLADQIRNQLLEEKIILEDQPDGTTIWRKE